MSRSLPRAVENGRQQRQRDVVAQRGDHVLLGDRAPIAGGNEHEIMAWIAAVEADETLQRVNIGGEIERGGHDLPPRPMRAVEGGGEGVLVDRRRAGDDDRLRLGPDQWREERPQLLTEGEPGRIRAEPAVDTEGLPLLQRAQRLGLGIAERSPSEFPSR